MQENLDKYKFSVENIDILQESDVHALVKIRVMHDGLNKNKTRHSLESIKNAIPSIYNIPIGIKYNVFKTDATEHIKDGEEETIQHNIGTIPQTNRITFVEEEGKLHLEAFGVIWKEDCKIAYELLKKGSLNQSMEEFVYQSEILPDGTMDITKFKFTRLQLLSNSVTPAMETAKVGLQYTEEEQDKVKSSNNYIEKILNEISTDEIIQREETILKERNKQESEQEVINAEQIENSGTEASKSEELKNVEPEGKTDDLENKAEKPCENIEKEYIEADKDLAKKYSELLETHVNQTVELDDLKEKYSKLNKSHEALLQYKTKTEADAKQAKFDNEVTVHIEKYDNFLNDVDKEYIKQLSQKDSITIEQIKNAIYEKVIINSKISEDVVEDKKTGFSSYSIIAGLKEKEQYFTPKDDFEKMVLFNKQKESERE